MATTLSVIAFPGTSNDLDLSYYQKARASL